MEDVESKLDMFMEMYKEDRRWQQQLFQLHHTSNPGTTDDKDPPDSPPPPSPYSKTHTVSALPRLRSILIEKPISEPNTPISKNPDKPMTRNLSDLGPRIKKRVTYRTLSSSSEICETPPSILKKPVLQRGQTQMEEFTFPVEDSNVPDSSPEQSVESKNESQEEELIDFKDPEPVAPSLAPRVTSPITPIAPSVTSPVRPVTSPLASPVASAGAPPLVPRVTSPLASPIAEINAHQPLTAETSFIERGAAGVDEEEGEEEGEGQSFTDCNSTESGLTVTGSSDTEDCMTEEGAGASDSLLPSRNNNTKDSLAHKFHMKPESQALLMRPEVLKLRKTTC
jgi:hypothetical protein